MLTIFKGAGVAADTARRLLLGETIPSGRFYVDLTKLVSPEASAALPDWEILEPSEGSYTLSFSHHTVPNVNILFCYSYAHNLLFCLLSFCISDMILTRILQLSVSQRLPLQSLFLLSLKERLQAP